MPQYFPPQPGGNTTTLDITAAAVIKNSPGRVYVVSVLSLGTAVGAIFDSASTSGNTVANQIGVIPEAVGTYYFYGIPTATGIVVTPPTTSTISVSWS
ncbi:hypothetical protein SAMN05216466_10777 [Paraburkholderia phenazinium]|uniref:Uncharacterized protein n=1 Tax=Paraburkholderia phenazinium TaxID=60549 RepID=A0A1G7ZL11_9BURK|nr:hypothetical protein [Paraburkholderia phenazinium]SDH09432.1 hypothetical protein SAMN05216466_10777 [Paraburkholderia phenazinium]